VLLLGAVTLLLCPLPCPVRSAPVAVKRGVETPSATPRIKTNPKDGATMIWIPPGPFLMGDDDDEIIDHFIEGHPRNNPRRTVTLSGYYIDKNPVTVAMYRRFCVATNRTMPPEPSWGWLDNHPMVNVSWDDATAYCDWAGVSLPTEAQWEKAARGTEGRKFPWGNDFDTGKLQCVSRNRNVRSTAPVGSFPAGASPQGVLDMAGNVWQWCADWYDKDYARSSPSQDPPGPGSGTYRVLRGGCWADLTTSDFRSANRGRNTPTSRDSLNGFRCVALSRTKVIPRKRGITFLQTASPPPAPDKI